MHKSTNIIASPSSPAATPIAARAIQECNVSGAMSSPTPLGCSLAPRRRIPSAPTGRERAKGRFCLAIDQLAPFGSPAIASLRRRRAEVPGMAHTDRGNVPSQFATTRVAPGAHDATWIRPLLAQHRPAERRH